jgi:hypothetical protein
MCHPGHRQQREHNPNHEKGERIGRGQAGKRSERTAYEIRELKRQLEGYEDEELRRIPIVREGSPLDEGATYIDLQEHPPREFTAEPDLVALRDNWFVPKNGVPRSLWDRLLRVAH